MAVLLQTSFFDDLVGSFLNTPAEIVLAVGVLVVLVVAPLGVYFFRAHKRSIDRRKQTELAYLEAIERFGLSPEESDIIDELCSLAPRGCECYELMHDESLFGQCEQKLLVGRPDRRPALARLKSKLGYGTMGETDRLYSTTELPIGSALYFEQQDIRRFGGTVLEVSEDRFAVRLDARTLPPPPGTELTAQFRRREGLYRFTTTVLATDGRVIHLKHVQGLEPTDQRLFFRKQVNAPAQARKTGSTERPVPATVVDISAGGCTVMNPEHQFQQGDQVELTLESRPPIRLVGKVLRASDEGDRLHLSFETLRQPVKDRLIRYIQTA